MATRLKTVTYFFPVTKSVTNNTLTTMTQITVYLPESSKSFKSVVAYCSIGETHTAVGNISTRTLQCRLGAAGYTAQTNSTAITNSGEDVCQFWAVDLTSHFNTNWSGTSMTMDAQVQFNSAATTAAWVNCSVWVEITYEYDDTSATHVKTVYLPLNAPVAALATSKPGTATDTVPNLTTLLPENSKTFRQYYVVLEGNIALAGGTTDQTISMQLDSTTADTTSAYEGFSATDYFFRYHWDISAVLNNNSTMGFYIWGNTAKVNHVQAYMVVTYEFTVSGTTGLYNSVLLPAQIVQPFMGGTTSSDHIRLSADLWIEEPATIANTRMAFMAHWDQQGTIGGLNMRLGTGSFVAYTDTAAVLAGSNAAMIRNDSAFTLARGKNTLTFDAYRTDTTDFGFGINGYFMVGYTSGVPSGGPGAANHTVMNHIGTLFGTGSSVLLQDSTAVALSIPETSYYLQNAGVMAWILSYSTAQFNSFSLQVERLAGESGINWEPVMIGTILTDPEMGLHVYYADSKQYFKQWPNDPRAGRFDFETARRWRLSSTNSASMFVLKQLVTYHSITFTVSGDVNGSAGGTVTLELEDDSSGGTVLSTTRAGNGSYSFTWYDNTSNVYVSAREDATHVGRSERGTAS